MKCKIGMSVLSNRWELNRGTMNQISNAADTSQKCLKHNEGRY